MDTQPASTKVIGSHARLAFGTLRAVWAIGRVERAEGELTRTLALVRDRRALAFARDWTFAELLEWSARRHRYAPFIEYAEQAYSFNDMNRRANRVARRLLASGVRAGDGVALMLSDHPRFLDAFFAIQKIGAYAVPVNTALVSEGLAYILEHSEVCAVVGDHETAARIAQVRATLPAIRHLWVNAEEAPAGYGLPEGARSFAELEGGTVADGEDLGVRPDPAAPSLLLYTSGTTGLPKAVVSLYGNQRVKSIGLLANLLYDKRDKLYTCLPLCHANALMLTVMQALWVGIPVHLAKRFSASRFWRDLAACGATQFNTVGSIDPHSAQDEPLGARPGAQGPARRQRGVPQGRVGAVREPLRRRALGGLWRGRRGRRDDLQCGHGAHRFARAPRATREVAARRRQGGGRSARTAGRALGVRGHEAWVERAVLEEREGHEREGRRRLVADRGPHASRREGVPLLRRPQHRLDASPRRERVGVRGREIVDAHPDVLESAAFGVPSPVGEQDIMVAVVPVSGRTIDPKAFAAFLRERLPKYAVPSYLEVVGELPKTGTHRVIKQELKARGVTASTLRLEDGPSA